MDRDIEILHFLRSLGGRRIPLVHADKHGAEWEYWLVSDGTQQRHLVIQMHKHRGFSVFESVTRRLGLKRTKAAILERLGRPPPN